MTTPHVLEQLPLWVEGDLTAPEQVEVERHLAACPDCRAAAQRLAASQAWLRDALTSPFAAVDEQRLQVRVMAQVRSEASARPAPSPVLRRSFLVGLAASLLLATLLWRLEFSRPAPTSGPAVIPSTQAAGAAPPALPEAGVASLPKLTSAPARARSRPSPEAGPPGPAGPARIEFQTADPTIRIIWLAQANPRPAPAASTEEPS